VKYLVKNKISGQTQGTAPTEDSRGELYVHPDLQKLEQELTNSFKSYIKFNKQKVQEIG